MKTKNTFLFFCLFFCAGDNTPVSGSVPISKTETSVPKTCPHPIDTTPLFVVTSIPPLEAIAKSVGAAHVKTFCFVQGGGSPHFVQMRPGFITKATEADLVVSMGETLEPFIDKHLQSLSLKNKWTRISHLSGLTTHKMRTRCCELPTTTKKSPYLNIDQHAWLSPTNGRLLTDWFVRQFSRLRPHLKDTFKANGDQLKKEITAAEKESRALLTPYKKVPFVVFHDGYQYFEKSFHLNHAGVIVTAGDKGGRPGQITKIVDRMKTQGIKCLFKEAQLPSPLAQKIARETDAQTITLDPLTSDDYPSLILNMAKDMKECLSQTSPGGHP